MIKYIFSTLIRGVLNKKRGYAKRLQEAGEFLSKLKKRGQMNTKPKKKKRKILEKLESEQFYRLPYDTIIELLLFLPYKNLRDIESDFLIREVKTKQKHHLQIQIFDNDFFWIRVFNTEFPYGLKYPVLLNELNPKYNWNEKLFLLKSSPVRIKEIFDQYEDEFYKPGNELLLLTYFLDNLNNHIDLIFKYIEKNYVLNDNFLKALIELYYFNPEYYPSIELHYFMRYISEKKYDKDKVLSKFLLQIYLDPFHTSSINYGDWVNEIFLEFKSYEKILKDKGFLLKLLMVGFILPTSFYYEAWSDLLWREKAKKIDSQIEEIIFDTKKFRKQRKRLKLISQYNSLDSSFKKSYIFNVWLIKDGKIDLKDYLLPEIKNDFWFRVLYEVKEFYYYHRDVKFKKKLEKHFDEFTKF